MIGLLRTALALLTIWLLGAFLLGGLGLRGRRWPLGYAQPALDFAAGSAILATLWVGAALAGIPMRAAFGWLVLGALGAAWLLRAVRRGKGMADAVETAPPSPQRVRWLAAAGMALALVVVFGLAGRTYVSPMFWDARYIWSFKAKVMFTDGRLDREAFTNLARYRHSHIDYPLAVPAAEVWLNQNVGYLDERKEKLVGLTYWLGTTVLLGCWFRRRMSWGPALGLALLTGTVPVAAYHATAGAADIPQGFHFLAGGVLAAEWLTSGRREDAQTSALMFGTGALVKAEGLSMALGGALVLGATLWARRRELTAGLAATCGLGLALPYLPWAVLRVAWGIPSPQLTGMYLRTWSETLSRTLVVAKAALSRLVLWNGWELLWLLVVFGLIVYLVARPRRAHPGVMWALLVWQSAVYAVVYVLSPYNVAHHLETSLDRLLLQLAALAMAATIGTIAPDLVSARGRSPAGNAPHSTNTSP